jgi:hypothetical protein
VFDVVLPDEGKPRRLQSTKFNVGATDDFIGEVETILGPNSVSISN